MYIAIYSCHVKRAVAYYISKLFMTLFGQSSNFPNGCISLAIASIYTKLWDFVKLDLHFMTMSCLFPPEIIILMYSLFLWSRDLSGFKLFVSLPL